MTKPFLLVASVIVAVTVAAPVMAGAQASRRGGGESSGGSSSGGSTAGARSAPSGGDGTVAVPRASAPAPSDPSTPSVSRSSGNSQPAGTSGSTRASGPRPTAGPGSAVRSDSVIGRQQTPAEQANLRLRGSQAIRGTAQPRPTPPRGSTIYGSYGSSTWFSPGYGFSYGYYNYNPWRYGYSGWGLYGSWYDPYLYDPFGYYGVYRPYGYSAFTPYYWTQPMMFTDEDSQPAPDKAPTGSLRLKVSPRSAKVYVDGALAGVVDEFDGLGGHLEIESGPHQLEFRADGYVPYTGQVNVKEGRTSTERVTLKKR